MAWGQVMGLQIGKRVLMFGGVCAVKRGAAEQNLYPSFIDYPRNRAPSQTQYIGVGVFGVDAKAAQLGHSAGKGRQSDKIVELRGIAVGDGFARYEMHQAKAADEHFGMGVFDQQMLAQIIKRIGIRGARHKAAIGDETEVTQSKGTVYILRLGGQSGGVVAFGQWQHSNL